MTLSITDETANVVRDLTILYLQRRHNERLLARLRLEGMRWHYDADRDIFRSTLEDGTFLATFAGDTVAMGVAALRNIRAQAN